MFRLLHPIGRIKNVELRHFGNQLNLTMARAALNNLMKSAQRSNSTGSQILGRNSYLGGRNLRLGHHVKLALANDEPIVALESTVITHGMPEPENRNLALELERIVWAQDCVPATIGIINGQIVIGLTQDEIDLLSRRETCKAMKASRRDIPIALALKRCAGTTVACTMSIACSFESRPIKVFATGGTGGVHKGGESTMDVSADLFEFSRSPIGVVSSGFKSFLDTRRSLEYLETLGCTVMSLREEASQRQLFPAFYSTENEEGIESPLCVESIEQAARILYECLESRFDTQAPSDLRGALLAVPIPKRFSLNNISDQLREAVIEIESRKNVQGFEKTPLILARLNEITKGQSLAANLELLKNNARVGSQLAREYKRIQNISSKMTLNLEPIISASNDKINQDVDQQQPVVIGCTMVDMHVSTRIDQNFRKNSYFSGVTFAGRPHLSVGGVGRNLAVALEYLGCSPRFVTALANDSLGQFACQNLDSVGLVKQSSPLIKITPVEDWSVATNSIPTSCFALVLRDSLSGQCEYVIANLDSINAIGRNEIMHQRDLIAKAPLIVLDANLSNEAIETSVELCFAHGRPIFIEPTDNLAIPRLTELLKTIEREHPRWLSSIVWMSPNLIEFQMMAHHMLAGQERDDCGDTRQDLGHFGGARNLAEIESLARKMMRVHMRRLKCLLITMDKDGVLVVSRIPLSHKSVALLTLDAESECNLHSQYYEVPERVDEAVSGSGAGDSFAAGFIAGIIRGDPNGSTIEQCVELGFKSARLSLTDEETISRKLIDLRNDMNVERNSF